MEEREGDAGAAEAAEEDQLPIPLSLQQPAEALVEFLGATRWVVLAFCCLASFTNNYIVDSPEALYEELRLWFSSDSEDAPINFDVFYLLFFVVFATPNVIVPPFGGMLADKLGSGLVVLVCLGIMAIGQGLVSVGVWKLLHGVVLLGRFVCGIGSEVVLTGVSSILTEWFALGHQSLAMGIMITFLRLGQVVTTLVGTTIALEGTVPLALGVGSMLGAVAFFISGVGLYHMQRRRFAVLKAATSESRSPVHHDSSKSAKDTGQSSFCSMQKLAAFPRSFWVLCVQIFFGNPSFLVFANICSALYLEEECGGSQCCSSLRINCDRQETAERGGMLFLVAVVIIFSATSPIIGLVVDRFGARGVICSLGAAGMVVSHALVVFTTTSLYVPGCLLGVSYAAFFGGTWNSVPVMVDENHVGLGFGLLLVFENAGGIVFPLAVAGARDASSSYRSADAVLLGTAITTFVCTVLLNSLDAAFESGALNRFANDRPSTFPSTQVHSRRVEQGDLDPLDPSQYFASTSPSTRRPGGDDEAPISGISNGYTADDDDIFDSRDQYGESGNPKSASLRLA